MPGGVPPVPAPPQLEMGHQNTDAGFAPDVDDLFQCLGHVVGLIAHMHVEDAVVAGRDFGERDEFFRGLVLVGRVDEPRRNAARAFLHAPGHAFFHKAQFFGGGRPVLHAHDVEAHGAEPHIGTQVDARLRGVERIEIGGEPVPAPRFLGYAVEPGNARAPRLLVLVADGGHRHAVEAYVLCGNPLHDFGQGQRLIYYPQIRMAVAVDEAGAQNVASDVEHRPGFGHIVGRTHGHDAPSRTPTQPLRQGLPVPSTMRALVKSRSSMNASPCQPSTMRRASSSSCSVMKGMPVS